MRQVVSVEAKENAPQALEGLELKEGDIDDGFSDIRCFCFLAWQKF